MKSIIIKTLAGIAVGSGLFVLAQSCTETRGKSAPIPKLADPIPVKVINLQKSEAQQSIITSGHLTTDDETILAFKTGGVVEAVFVTEGDKVSKGQVLATLDLTEINSFVAQAKSGLDKAQRDFQRATNLYRDSVATLEQLQNTATGLELAKQQYNAAVFNRGFSSIKAPASGYVLKKFVNPGQVVGIGDPIVKTNGAGDGKWILKTGVSDKQWSSIQLKSEAEVEVDAFPSRVFSGRVIRKSETADPATGAFTVEILVEGDDVRFASGMFGSATIKASETSASWNIPYEAVLDANGNDGFVFITVNNKTALKKPVKIDSFNGSSVRVSSGLEGARSLIVSGSAYLTDNSPITITR
jgi:RND family efflux transporter MFP subunit